MEIRKKVYLQIVLILLLMIVGCSGASNSNSDNDDQTTQTSVDETSSDTSDDQSEEVSNGEDHDEDSDYTWDASEEISIVLANSITTDSDNVLIVGNIATIVSAGNYNISGTMEDGQIIVDTEDEEVVRLILSGVEISSSSSAPIYIKSAAKVIINLADGSENTISDASTYVFDTEDEEPNAAIYSKADMTIFGSGRLSVSGNYNDGIAGTDGLIITSGTYDVNALDDGIRGKDYLIIKDGDLVVTAQGDGLKADNEEDESLGYITVESGVIDLDAGGDGIVAEKNVTISDGQLTIAAGGGSSAAIDLETLSAKGIKSASSVIVDGGTLTIDTADDAIHSNGVLEINGGVMDIASADDGMHADTALTINGGDIIISESYEGIESAVITINDGELSIVASDDGVNVAGGTDDSAVDRPGQGDFTDTGDNYLYIYGGYIAVDAQGDGIDVNGSFEMSGGNVIVHGPTDSANGPLDYGTFNISGGFIVAAGSSGMAQVAGSTSSAQNSLLVNFSSTQSAGSLVHIQSADGTGILTFAPLKTYQSLTFSSADLALNTSYEIYLGGSSTASQTDGLYEDGGYSSGTLYTSFTVSDTVTQVGSQGNDGRRGGM